MSKTDFYPRSDEGVTTTAPYRRRVGQECELAGGHEFSAYAWKKGLGTPPRSTIKVTRSTWDGYGGNHLHNAHCICDDGYRYPIHTTMETSGGEHVIGGPTGVLFASPAYMDAIAAVAECADATGHGGEDGGYGGHTHVQTKDLSLEAMRIFTRNVKTLWPRIQEVSTGAFAETRSQGYTNPQFSFTLPPDTPVPPIEGGERLIPACGDTYCRTCARITRQELHSSRSYAPAPSTQDVWYDGEITAIQSASGTFRLSHAGEDLDVTSTRRGGTRATTEWRVWNTQTSRWRLYLAAGVSSSMVEAAHQGRAIEKIEEGAPLPTLEDFLDGLLNDDLKLLMDRQRAIVRGDMSWAA